MSSQNLNIGNKNEWIWALMLAADCWLMGYYTHNATTSTALGKILRSPLLTVDS